MLFCTGAMIVAASGMWLADVAPPVEPPVEVEVDEKKPAEIQLTQPAALQTAEVTKLREQGLSNLSDALATMPAMISMQGNAGLGSTDTKLNVGARGVDPRFAQRTAVLLDGVPMAASLHGRPHYELVPLPLALLGKLEVQPSGVAFDVGPHSTGGIVRLTSPTIPQRPTLTALANADQWGRISLGAHFGGTMGKVGVSAGYAPRWGNGERVHDRFVTHAVMVRTVIRAGTSHRLEAAAHGYWEESQLPGGLSLAAFKNNPRQSLRTQDTLGGYRLGGSLRWHYQPSWRREVSVMAFGAHTDRTSSLANDYDGLADKLREQPRVFDFVALEPRFDWRTRLSPNVSHEVTLGARSSYETGVLRSIEVEVPSQARETTAVDEFAIWGHAFYLKDEVALGRLSRQPEHERWRIRVGGRLESSWATARDRVMPQSKKIHRYDVLPDIAVNLRLTAHTSIFAAYGHTFGPPHFLQLRLASDERNYQAERGRSAELGAKVQGYAGLHGSVVGWFKYVRDYADVSLDAFVQPGDTRALGADVDLTWKVGEALKSLRGLEVGTAYTYSHATIAAGDLEGKRMPWYPDHRMRSRLLYRHAWGWMAGTSILATSRYYTDFANTGPSDETGGIGKVPAFVLVDAFAGYERQWSRHVHAGLNIALRNLGNTSWYSRTSDRNAGILPLLPRTFFASLVIRFVPPSAR